MGILNDDKHLLRIYNRWAEEPGRLGAFPARVIDLNLDMGG